MSPQPPKILFVGDYWHSDFKTLTANPACVARQVPTEQLSTEHLSNSSFDLVVLAAARRNQFSHEWVESIRSKLAPTPLVALLGSWCEGEERSGEPWPGVQRVYWHQWQGRFDFFLKQLAANQICDWHLPATANQADGVINQNLKDTLGAVDQNLTASVSAVSAMHYQMVADALQFFGAKPVWIEQGQGPRQGQGDGSGSKHADLIVVDGDSWNQDLKSRIDWLRNDLAFHSPIVLLLNFPRPSDLAELYSMGITEVISKPFQLTDLTLAAERAIGESRLCEARS